VDAEARVIPADGVASVEPEAPAKSWRRLPRLLFDAVRLVRRAAPRQLRMVTTMMVVGGVATA
jgi:hypothetical protein